MFSFLSLSHVLPVEHRARTACDHSLEYYTAPEGSFAFPEAVASSDSFQLGSVWGPGPFPDHDSEPEVVDS